MYNKRYIESETLTQKGKYQPTRH